MKRILPALLLMMCGCSQNGPPQAKRVWVMSDQDNWYFVIKEPSGRLTYLSTCQHVAMWKGMHADILVRLHPDGDAPNGGCWEVDSITEVSDGGTK